MLRDEVETPVAVAVLLAEIPAQAFAPQMRAARVAAQHQPVTRRTQPIAHVVVVPVAEALVEQPDAVECIRTVGGVAGADVIGGRAANRAIALLEIEAHHTRRPARSRIGYVIALD